MFIFHIFYKNLYAFYLSASYSRIKKTRGFLNCTIKECVAFLNSRITSLS